MKKPLVIRFSLWVAGMLAALLGFISWVDLMIPTLFFDELAVMLIGLAYVWLVKKMNNYYSD